jgi:hypothetical protein
MSNKYQTKSLTFHDMSVRCRRECKQYNSYIKSYVEEFFTHGVFVEYWYVFVKNELKS